MLKPFLFLFVLLTFSQLQSQGTDTDSTYHYIILRPYSKFGSSHILQEGHRIKLFDRNGNITSGRMYFINDSTIQTINSHTKRKDTCSIDNIYKIKIYSPLNTLKGYGILASGAIVGAIGISMFFYTDDPSRPISEAITKITGAAVIATSVPIIKHGLNTMTGKSFKRSKHKFIYYTSRGKKIKRKDLKTLFPITP